MEPCALLALAHGQVLRLLASHAGDHFQGLHQACRHKAYHHFPTSLRRRIEHLEITHHFVRHVTEPLIKNLLEEINSLLHDPIMSQLADDETDKSTQTHLMLHHFVMADAINMASHDADEYEAEFFGHHTENSTIAHNADDSPEGYGITSVPDDSSKDDDADSNLDNATDDSPQDCSDTHIMMKSSTHDGSTTNSSKGDGLASVPDDSDKYDYDSDKYDSSKYGDSDKHDNDKYDSTQYSSANDSDKYDSPECIPDSTSDDLLPKDILEIMNEAAAFEPNATLLKYYSDYPAILIDDATKTKPAAAEGPADLPRGSVLRLAPVSQRGMAGSSAKAPRAHSKKKTSGKGSRHAARTPLPRNASGKHATT